jgi:hypothetical protein
MPDERPQLAPNWTSAAGAVEGILAHLGAPLPRHAIMGLTALAWHTCLGTRGGVTALPSGPADVDWERVIRALGRTGFTWERFGAELGHGADWSEMRATAVRWATAHLDAARPLVGWDFHLHEFAVVYGYDHVREGFLVDDVLSEEVGPFFPWRDWPSAVGRIEFWAPVAPREDEAAEAVAGAMADAAAAFAGDDGREDGQPRGTAALDAWAEALDGAGEIDRAGNAYTIQVLQAARLDGAAFLRDVADALPALSEPLGRAARATGDETKALSPLITLFPFPTGGHGNVNSPGLRRAAAMALRRAATHERSAAGAIAEALDILVAAGVAPP